ncbi:MAG TPA: methyltransferase domain-containing protein [Gammaproteobacteria bacterium]|nr:methyltransferase domain-containing protein [Gammaproteobacteria bacterium]
MTLERQQDDVRAYWNAKPCNSELSQAEMGSREYFLEIERDRYTHEAHILEVLSKIDWQGKDVLEIGTGVGTDARQIISRGGRYTGINVDQGSVEATRQALGTFGLSGEVRQCSATAMDFEDARFDVIYSFGVLHHIPNVDRAVEEIRRVLKPDGELLIMLYNRSSVNYRVEIRLLRKLGVRLLGVPGVVPAFSLLGLPRDKLDRHRELSKRLSTMSDEEWLSRNTDGPDNPYSLVYGARDAERLLAGFQVVEQTVYFFDPRHWGALGRLTPSGVVEGIGRRWGWHRVVLARKLP